MKATGKETLEDSLKSEHTSKEKRNKLNEHELEELREHIDLISFNIGKVYRHARDRSRKEYNQVKQSLRRKLHHSYKSEKFST